MKFGRLIFKLFYNTYNQNIWESEKAVLSLLAQNPDAEFLDCGCYDGEFTMREAQEIGTKKVYGIDSMEKVINQSSSKGIEVIKADLNQDFPFRDETFDVICACHVIEHLCNTDTFVKETFRILKPNGYVCMSTPNLAAVHDIFMLLAGKQPLEAAVSDEFRVGSYHIMKAQQRYPAHRRMFTFEALKELLEYHGFEVEKTIGSGFFPLPVRLARVICLVDKVHATHITVKARKRLR